GYELDLGVEAVVLIGAEPADLVAEAEADAAAEAATTSRFADAVETPGLAGGHARIEARPARGVAACAVGLEDQLPVAHVGAPPSPRLGPGERVLVLGDRNGGGGVRAARGALLRLDLARVVLRPAADHAPRRHRSAGAAVGDDVGDAALQPGPIVGVDALGVLGEAQQHRVERRHGPRHLLAVAQRVLRAAAPAVGAVALRA